ncbi:MAG TPA: hypothetical protein VKR58_03940 [Aquella sp.]|nr:hypothetical protein [Aquella sp.]
MTDDLNISVKLKTFLQRKLEETSLRIQKVKRKKRIIQILSISTAVISIVISAIVASLALPPLAVSIMCVSSAILTGVNLRFNFQNKTVDLKNLIDKLNKIQAKLDYVISCNGNLTQTAYQEILKEFNL